MKYLGKTKTLKQQTTWLQHAFILPNTLLCLERGSFQSCTSVLKTEAFISCLPSSLFFFCLLSPLKKWNQKCFLSFWRNHKCHFGSTGLLRIHACLFVHTLLISQQPFRDQVRKWVHTIIISNSVRGHLNSMTVLYFIYLCPSWPFSLLCQ